MKLIGLLLTLPLIVLVCITVYKFYLVEVLGILILLSFMLGFYLIGENND